MTSELIYEGLGEVTAVENKIVVTAGADSTNLEKMQFFSQEMTDDAVAEFIFDSCDIERSGKVNISVLVEFLLKSCGGESEENREIFHGLLVMLDPQQLDPPITSDVFQAGLKNWISQLVSDTEESDTVFMNSLRFSKIESEQSDSGNSLCTSQPSSEISSDVHGDELQFQHTKLQEIHKKLQTQLAEVDENNLKLHNENCNLQTKILNSIEMELKEKTEELKQLQDDNSFLHHDLEDKKDNIQKLLQRYEMCEKELADQNRELETLQKQYSAEKETIKMLEDKIQHLEQIIRTRESEIDDKEKDIHLLTLQLNEHQSTLDQSLASAERRLSLAPLEVTSLASELKCASPMMAISWKKPKDNLKEQDYILPWNAMFNEPEFEDELSQETISFSRGQTPVAGSGVQVLHEMNAADSSHSSSTSSHSLSPKVNYRFNMISTPKTGRSHVDFDLSGVGSTVHTMDSPTRSFYKATSLEAPTCANPLKKISLAILSIFIVLFAATMTIVWGLLFLSMIDAGDCSSYGGRHCSPWTKLIDFLKPYCHMEHVGLPPV